jgi:hypothetical protein
MLGALVDGTNSRDEYKGANASRALVRATRIVRIVRMLRVMRILKLYRFVPNMPHIPFIHGPKKSLHELRRAATMGEMMRRDPSGQSLSRRQNSNGYIPDYIPSYNSIRTQTDESMAESHVGAAMTDLTNRRYVCEQYDTLLPILVCTRVR